MNEAKTVRVEGTVKVAVSATIHETADKRRKEEALRRQAEKGDWDHVLGAEYGEEYPHD